MKDSCLICNGVTEPYITKHFNSYGLGQVEYWRCVSCGFVLSKTLADISDERWGKVNNDFHASFQGTDCCPDDPQWVQRINKQAEVIADLKKIDILSSEEPWVDFGCGDGKLSGVLLEKYHLKLMKYERFMNQNGYLSEDTLKCTRFGFVITTSVFEHLRKRKYLDEIASLVADNGVMGIHTLVAEDIPSSPEWFYLLPVHCAFYTNKSMEILFHQWGFSSSIYNVDSRLWFWFKSNDKRLEEIISAANALPGRESLFYHYKRGFMDYWKLDADSMLKKVITKKRYSENNCYKR